MQINKGRMMIDVAQSGGLRVLTLNRPDKANALTLGMLTDLAEAVETAAPDGARALILTGSGRVFSAGADLAAAREGLATDPVWERLSGAIAAFPGLSIAALNGSLAGGAMGMALACDLRIAVTGAMFFYPVMKLGYLPQPSDPGRLSALIGPARAKMILLAGARIGTEDALAWGLIDRVSTPDTLIDTARSLAAEMLSASASHGSAIKRMIPGSAPQCL